MKNIFGNKGYNLMKLDEAGINVPPFMLVNSEILEEQDYITHILEVLDLEDGIDWSKKVSVRSSGVVSMPGLLHTELNVSLEELLPAIDKVKASWDTKEAKFYRSIMNISDKDCGGIVIQQMVKADTGGAGVCTVQPGPHGIIATGEFVTGMFGDSLVGGVIKPKKWTDLPGWVMDEMLVQLEKIYNLFEKPQEVEFAWDVDNVYVLQSRDWDVVYEEPAYCVVQVGQCAHPGTVIGQIFRKGESSEGLTNPIFVAEYTMPEDVESMFKSKGIITMVGGSLSHAAILAHKFKIPCLVGTGMSIKSFKHGAWMQLKAHEGNIKLFGDDNI